MSYRKLKADYLFDGFKMYDSKVLVCGQDGIIESVLDEEQAGESLEKFSGILSPGFINCHCHLELSYLKGQIDENQGLVNFVLSVVKNRNIHEEIKLHASESAESDMLKSGIVAVGDICNTTDTRILKSEKRLSYYNFIEVLGWTPGVAVSRYENAKKTAALFIESGADEEHLSLNPHAPYSVSDNLWELMKTGFQNKTITIHNQESAAENDYFISASGDLARMYFLLKMDTAHFKAPGTRSLAHYLPKLKTAAHILLVHNTFTNDEDLSNALSQNENLHFCLCPNANLYIENRMPEIPLFMKYKTNLVLGTDSLASNHQLNILEEMKTIKNIFPLIPTSQLLLWATSNGAKVLSFDKTLGDFRKGKKPGVVLIENTPGGEISEVSKSRRLL